MKIRKLIISQYSTLTHRNYAKGTKIRFSSYTEEPKLKSFIQYIDSLKNYEKSGVPKDAGTDSDDGFDLGRMMTLIGNPQSNFKACPFPFSIELDDLSVLGTHQLQNAVTATCAALCLSNQGRQLDAVFLTEVDIAGGTSRMTSASVLRDCWMQASEEFCTKVLHDKTTGCGQLFVDSEHETILACREAAIGFPEAC
ncbi:hypothetical protein V6N13_077345 [Hibiscus sabdariffa]|uniref:Uncharacterized protein n=1 Tax=Hibiscus sabdariffa TaxID=183260 RepID=A0ABR2CNK2_9ROSI